MDMPFFKSTFGALYFSCADQTGVRQRDTCINAPDPRSSKATTGTYSDDAFVDPRSYARRWTSTISALIGIFLSALAVGAGSISSAQVLGVRVDREGKGLVIFDRPVGAAPPSCVIAYYANALAFNANEVGGKAILALALAAKASGDPVTAHGTGACAIYGHSVEDWSTGQTE
jgi:hypothetical protein